MYSDDKQTLKSLERSPDRFRQVCSIAAKAKQVARKYNGQLFHSQAITCVVTHQYPKYDYKRDDTKLDCLIKDSFCEIEDVDVRNAVYDSLMLSARNHYLIYQYNNIQDASTQARVRVLTNLLWYEASQVR